MNIFSLIPSGYQLLAKVIASVLLVIALYAAWHSFTGHYVDIGRKEVQLEWDKQKKVDADAHVQDLLAVQAAERKDAEVNSKTDKKLIEDKINENKALNIQLNAVRSDNRQLRTITGKTIGGQTTGKGETNTSSNVSDATCTVQLPRELDEGFKQLQLDVIRIGSEADNTAKQLKAAQDIITQDRITCNGE